MAKFSEFMQHSRVAKWFNRQHATASNAEAVAGDAGDGGEDNHLDTVDIIDDSIFRPKRADQATTQDGIVAQSVTPDAEQERSQARKRQETAPTLATFTLGASTLGKAKLRAANADDLDSESETVWEDALHSLPVPQRRLQRLLPATARIGALGIVAFAMWWTWPRADAPDAWVNDARAGDLESLAVVNPANIQQEGVIARAATATPEPTAQVDQFANIVIVTPTSVQQVIPSGNEEPDETLVLEASALVTDANGDAIVIEIPEAVPVESLMPALEEEPVAETQPAVQTEIILIPTPTPSPTAVAVAINSGNIPKVEIVPAIGARATTAPAEPTVSPTATSTPTATPPPIGPGRLWSTFTPLPAAESDHFWIGNPFEGYSGNRFASPSYQFGSTAGNRYRPHHGLDISNPSGTPVQAAVEGTVVHAGPDDPDVLGPYPNFYGQAVVIRLDRQLPVAGGNLDVYVLYGHLSEVRAEVGQHVQPSDIIGLVGMSGIAIGPHLHIETRLGANTYDHSVNPYLWVKPAEGNGAVAIRVLTANGRTWAGAKVSIARFEGGRAVWGRQIETYLDTENIGPDPRWGENGAMGDVPAGSYTLLANINGESIRADFTVTAGETTFVEIRTQQ